MKTTVVFLLATLLTAVRGQYNGNDTSQQPVLAELGRSIQIPCNYTLENETLFSLSWKKGGNNIAIFGNGRKIIMGEYKRRAALDTEDLKLTLEDLSFDDNGEYTCTVTTEKGATSLSEVLQVLAAPTINAISFPILLPPNYNSGETVEQILAECKATGGSEPYTMKWIDEDGRVLVGEEEMESSPNIDNPDLTDATLYLAKVPQPDVDNNKEVRCIVENALGGAREIPVTTAVTIQTTTPPTTTIQAKPMFIGFPTKGGGSISMRIGESRKFVCTISGVPSPTVSWYRLPYQQSPIERDMGSASLTLNALSFEDSGSYKCKGRNREGSVDRSLRVEVLGAPVMIGAEQETNISDTVKANPEDQFIVLTCKAKGNPVTGFEWKIEGANFSDVATKNDEFEFITVTSTANISISKISRETKVKCIASNLYGSESKDFIVYVPEVATANVGLIVGIVIAVIAALALVFFIVYFTLESRKRRQANLSSDASAESGFLARFSSCCASKKSLSAETEDTHENEQLKEEGTKEEKQKLTSAEEQPAEKDKEGSPSEEGEEEPQEEQAKTKKKKRITFATQCCRSNKRQLKEDESVHGDGKELSTCEDSVQETKKETTPKDTDSGKGDTLEKVIEETAK